MTDDEYADLRAQVLAHLSLNRPASYGKTVEAVAKMQPTQIWHIMERAIVAGIIVAAPVQEGLRGTRYTLADGYEWHGPRGPSVPTQYHIRWKGSRKLGCYASHTAGFECHRAPGHSGRHASSGTRAVLAVWLPGGRFDPASAFTDAERRALDIDAASAFFE